MINVVDAVSNRCEHVDVMVTGLYDALYREYVSTNAIPAKPDDMSVIDYMESYTHRNGSKVLCDQQMIFPHFISQCDDVFEQLLMTPKSLSCDNEIALLNVVGEKVAKHINGKTYTRHCVGSTCHGVINTDDIYLDTEIRVMYDYIKMEQSYKEIALKQQRWLVVVNGVYLWSSGKVKKIDKAETTFKLSRSTSNPLSKKVTLQFIANKMREYLKA